MSQVSQASSVTHRHSRDSATRSTGNRSPAGQQQDPNSPHGTLELVLGGTWRSLLSQAYLVGLPTSRGLWCRAADAMPKEASPLQQELLSLLCLLSTIDHPLALRYPRDTNHSLATLVWLQGKFRCKGWRHDYFDERIKSCRNQLKCAPQPELAYKSYIMTENGCDNYEKLIHDNIESYLVNRQNNGRARLLRIEDIVKPAISESDHQFNTNLDENCENICNPESDSIRCKSNDQRIPSHDNGIGEMVSDSCHVSLLESIDGITRGTTGLTSWGGGAILGEWLQNNKQLLDGKNILELGAGIGYMATVILRTCVPATKRRVWRTNNSQPAAGDDHQAVDSAPDHHQHLANYCGPASYTATDCHPHVLDLLYHNLALMENRQSWSYSCLASHTGVLCNTIVKGGLDGGWVNPASPWQSPTKQLTIAGVDTKVVYLDWRAEDLSTIPACDVIVAADIVYAKHLLDPLAGILRCLLSRATPPAACQSTAGRRPSAGGRRPPPASEAYIACTRRSDETIGLFLSALEQHGLTQNLVYEATLDTHSALFYYNEASIPIKIFRITFQE